LTTEYRITKFHKVRRRFGDGNLYYRADIVFPLEQGVMVATQMIFAVAEVIPGFRFLIGTLGQMVDWKRHKLSLFFHTKNDLLKLRLLDPTATV
jgi:hypothetical protein